MAAPLPRPDGTLFVDGRAVAAVAVAGGRRERGRGLLGCDGIDGALLLPGTASVHTVGMRFTIDVALLDRDRCVVAVRVGVAPGRIVLPRPRVRSVLEAATGSFARWDLGPGSQLEVGLRPLSPGRR